MELFDIVMDKIDKGLKNIGDFKIVFNIAYNSKIIRNKRIEPLAEDFTRIKKLMINKYDELVKTAVESLENRDCNVLLAKTQQEALDYILNEVQGEDIIVKSKSETGKEIGLSKFLEKHGFEGKIIETDLGDRIIQLINEKPSIPMGPAVHLSPKEVADKLSEIYNIELQPTPQEIVKFGKEKLRKDILSANIGITGANVIVANDGIIGLMENEGNISLITRLPDKHICLAGTDKIVPTWHDAISVLEMAEASLDLMGAYTSFIKGPSRTADVQGVEVIGMHGAKEVHVVLLDDFRSKIVGTDFEQSLMCINCGRCFLSCPVIKSLGLEIFNSKYSRGPIGLIKTYLLAENGLEESVKMGLFTCTLCGRCEENCPSNINMPDMIMKLRKMAIEKGLVMEQHQNILDSIVEYDNPFSKKINKKLQV
ncbi:MAG: 4Fe-4S dicluster domain-containing protein [Candidatus Lokiarchaeota archaeon]|nr:4Fe-4S dicluster domain-containing protein [Candidatus Lokiarchaeota archaeon]